MSKSSSSTRSLSSIVCSIAASTSAKDISSISVGISKLYTKICICGLAVPSSKSALRGRVSFYVFDDTTYAYFCFFGPTVCYVSLFLLCEFDSIVVLVLIVASLFSVELLHVVCDTLPSFVMCLFASFFFVIVFFTAVFR